MTHTLSLILLIETLGWNDFSRDKAAALLELNLEEMPEKEQVVHDFHQIMTEKLKETIDLKDLKEAPLKEQVMEIILCRLELLAPYKSALKRIYQDVKEDLCAIPSLLWQAKLETEWLNLLGNQNPIQNRLLGLLYWAVVVHWLLNDDLNKTMAFLDRGMRWV